MSSFISRATSVETASNIIDFRIQATTNVTALIKGEEYYQWYSFTGAPMRFRRSGEAAGEMVYMLNKGDLFGVRRSANGKKIRLILKEWGPTRVFTLDASAAKKLAAISKPYFKLKDLAKPNKGSAFRLLRSLGMFKVLFKPGDSNLERIVFAVRPIFPYSIKTAVNVLVEFYKDAGAYRSVSRDVDAYTINLKFSPTAALVLVLNAQTNDVDDPPSEIIFVR